MTTAAASQTLDPVALSEAPEVDERALDDELMERVKAGDEYAFARIVDRHQRALVAYLSRLTGQLERAEDLAQEAFVRLYQHANRYESRRRLLPYLYRIATNLVRSEQRRAQRWRRLRPMFEAATPTQERPAGERKMLRDELGRRLRAELDALPMTYRVPIVLAEIEEWSYAEIAELLGCRVGTVKSRVFRGRKKLREALTPDLEGGVL